MADTFAASEIIQMAINIEENGRDFYNKAAEGSNSDPVKAIFNFLSGQEEKHIKIFKGALADLKIYNIQGIYTQEYFLYMKAISGQNVFTKEKSVVLNKIKNDIDAIDLAMNFERDSILFYTEMKNYVIEDKKSAVDSLIKQEREHFVKLMNLKAELTKVQGSMQ